MKTYALVEISGLRHMVDDRQAADELRRDAEARGVRLILMRPMEHIDDGERFEAIAGNIRAGGGGPGNQDQWSMIMSALDELKAAVAKNTTVVASTITLLSGLSQKINSANTNNDPAISALAAEVNAEADKLGAAIAANTVAADERPTNPAAPPGDPTADTPSA